MNIFHALVKKEEINMRLFISFSARNDGNCDELAKFLAKEEDKIIYLRDLNIHNYNCCNY